MHGEQRRLEVLRAYDVLDTPPEAGFDELTQLLADICRTPAAVLSLIDSERQWFKSVVGLTFRETDRAVSFCDHAIRQRGLFVVEDARIDPRFAGNPQVTAPAGVRFYAGMPLVTAGGSALGALAVVDRVPRRLDALQSRAVEVLSRQAMALLHARRCQRRLEDALQGRLAVQAALSDSEARWRQLFERNPMPMWIYDPVTLRFLAVNDSALMRYGWTAGEFLSMTLADIRPLVDVPALQAEVGVRTTSMVAGRPWRHCTRDGRIIDVMITSHGLSFAGRDARLVMVEDAGPRAPAVDAVPPEAGQVLAA